MGLGLVECIVQFKICQPEDTGNDLLEERATYSDKVRENFAFLEEGGFELEKLELEWPASTNFECLYSGDDLYILIKRVMGITQVLVSVDREEWLEKDEWLDMIGVSKKRHPTNDLGHWTGYRLSTQAKDLQEHLDLLLTHFVQR